MGMRQWFATHFLDISGDQEIRVKRKQVHDTMDSAQARMARAIVDLAEERKRHNKKMARAQQELETVADQIARLAGR